MFVHKHRTAIAVLMMLLAGPQFSLWGQEESRGRRGSARGGGQPAATRQPAARHQRARPQATQPQARQPQVRPQASQPQIRRPQVQQPPRSVQPNATRPQAHPQITQPRAQQPRTLPAPAQRIPGHSGQAPGLRGQTSGSPQQQAAPAQRPQSPPAGNRGIGNGRGSGTPRLGDPRTQPQLDGRTQRDGRERTFQQRTDQPQVRPDQQRTPQTRPNDRDQQDRDRFDIRRGTATPGDRDRMSPGGNALSPDRQASRQDRVNNLRDWITRRPDFDRRDDGIGNGRGRGDRDGRDRGDRDGRGDRDWDRDWDRNRDWDWSWNRHNHRHDHWRRGDWWNRGNFGWNLGWGRSPLAGFFGLNLWRINRPAYRFGYWGYSNPYYVQPFAINPIYDYSQPLIYTDSNAYSPVAMSAFDQARLAFHNGDYGSALQYTDQAIAEMPRDPALHEFRALVLFAQGEFSEAAAVIYAVLSVGPGWDWATMQSLYPNVDLYTRQLRALEAHIKANPRAADARFLLAYHYLTMGHADAAQRQYEQIVRLQPEDRLSQELLQSLSNEGGQPSQAAPPATLAPGQSIPEGALVGTWNATGPQDARFQMALRQDGTFTWTRTASGGHQQSIGGVYALNGNVLALEPDDGDPMVAEVQLTADNELGFRMVGAPENEPGLTFRR